jgi:hypothetical protein
VTFKVKDSFWPALSAKVRFKISRLAAVDFAGEMKVKLEARIESIRRPPKLDFENRAIWINKARLQFKWILLLTVFIQ